MSSDRSNQSSDRSTPTSDTKSSDTGTSTSSDDNQQSSLWNCLGGRSPRKSPKKSSSEKKKSPQVALTSYTSISPDQVDMQTVQPQEPHDEHHVRQLDFPSQGATAMADTPSSEEYGTEMQVVADVHQSDIPVKMKVGQYIYRKKSPNYKPKVEQGYKPSKSDSRKCPSEYMGKSPSSIFPGKSSQKPDAGKGKSPKSVPKGNSPQETESTKAKSPMSESTKVKSPSSSSKGNSSQSKNLDKAKSPTSLFGGKSPQEKNSGKAKSPKPTIKVSSPQETDPGKPPVGPNTRSPPSKDARSKSPDRSQYMLASPMSPPDDESRYRSKSDPGQPPKIDQNPPRCYSIASYPDDSSTYSSCTTVSSCNDPSCNCCNNSCSAGVGNIIAKCKHKLHISPKRASLKSPEKDEKQLLPGHSRAGKSAQRSSSDGCKSKDRRRPSISPERDDAFRFPERPGGACRSPERGGTRRSPERGGAYRSPERGGACGSPERGGTRRSPERGGACRSPERGAACRSPERGAACRSPERGSTRRSPERGAACRSPERGGACRSPERGAAYRSPERGAACRSPEKSEETSPGKKFEKQKHVPKPLEHGSPVVRCKHARPEGRGRQRSISLNDDEIEVMEAEATDDDHRPQNMLRPHIKCSECKHKCKFNLYQKLSEAKKFSAAETSSEWHHVRECHSGRVERAVCHDPRGPGHDNDEEKKDEEKKVTESPRSRSVSTLFPCFSEDTVPEDENDDDEDDDNKPGSAWV